MKSHQATDSALLQALRLRQRVAFDILYERYAPLLYGIIKKAVDDEAIAAQLLLNTFQKAWNSIDAYDPDSMRLFTWLFLHSKRCIESRGIDCPKPAIDTSITMPAVSDHI